MKRRLDKFIIVVAAIMISNVVAAQPGPPPPVGLPIDGGVTFLIVSGLVFAVSKLRKKE